MRKMKDSGIEWIGEIPEEWGITRLKYLYIYTNAGEVIDKGYWDKGDECLYTCQKNPIISDYDSFPAQKRTTNSDLLLTRNATPYIFLPQYGAIYTNVVQRIHIMPMQDRRYIKYSLQCGIDALTVYGDTIPSYNMQVWNSVAVPRIPFYLQSRIADYLDDKCGKIDRYIETQREIIEKLKAYKQAVITEAVTKGLDPTVPMKDSGVEWIGKIPEGWRVGQLKYFVKIRSGITLGKKYSPETELKKYPYLRVANVQGEYTDLSDVAMISVPEDEAQKYILHTGELLMTEGGDRDKLGRGCVWNGEITPCLHQNHVFAVMANALRLNVYYLDYVTTSDVGRSYFDYTAKKTTNLASTNSTTILQFRLPVPLIEEQQKIVQYLKEKVDELNQMLTKHLALIDKLTEYKKALIYEVVTGKREV